MTGRLLLHWSLLGKLGPLSLIFVGNKQLIPKSHSCVKQHYQCVNDRHLSISMLLEYIGLGGKNLQVFVNHEFLI